MSDPLQSDFSEDPMRGLRRSFDAHKALRLAAYEWYKAYRSEDLINLKGAEDALCVAVEGVLEA